MAARDHFSKHFNAQKTQILAIAGKFSDYMATLGRKFDSKSHESVQLKKVKSADFEASVRRFDEARKAQKEMQEDAKLVGLAADAPAMLAATVARREMTELNGSLLADWQEKQEKGWPGAAVTELRDAIVAKYAELGAKIKTFKDTTNALRKALTVQLNAAAFRTIAAEAAPAFQEKLAAIAKEVAPPAEPEDSNSEAGGIDLGEESDGEESSDELQLVEKSDDERVEQTVVDDISKSADSASDTESAEIAPVEPKARPARRGKQAAIERIQAAAKRRKVESDSEDSEDENFQLGDKLKVPKYVVDDDRSDDGSSEEEEEEEPVIEEPVDV